jgi:hypothetical protein
MVSSLSGGFCLPEHHRLRELTEHRCHRESVVPATGNASTPRAAIASSAEIGALERLVLNGHQGLLGRRVTKMPVG